MGEAIIVNYFILVYLLLDFAKPTQVEVTSEYLDSFAEGDEKIPFRQSNVYVDLMWQVKNDKLTFKPNNVLTLTMDKGVYDESLPTEELDDDDEHDDEPYKFDQMNDAQEAQLESRPSMRMSTNWDEAEE